MADWVLVGDNIMNVDNIEYVERINHDEIRVHMGSGKIIELKNTVALTLWKFIDGERLKFLDLENPTSDFSRT
jgi:hypothetical protein